jgi:hypothetical protein
MSDDFIILFIGGKLTKIIFFFFGGKWTVEENGISFLKESGYGPYNM